MAAVVASLVGAVAALAYWSAPGSGSGSAAAGTLADVTVEATAGVSPADTLVPGGTAEVVLRITNPNAYPVTLYSVTASGPVTADAGHPGCTTTGVSFSAPAAPVSPTVTLAAQATTVVRLPAAASMSSSSSSSCQGATFAIPVTATVAR